MLLSPATSSKKIKKSSSSSKKKQHSKKKSPCQPSSSNYVQKSSCISRIFTEEDELKILEAVLEIQEDEPIIPAKAAVAIFNDIQNKITAQVNITQLREKLRKLRRKNCDELTDEKLDPPHKQKLSILCKRIWGVKKNTVKQKMLLKDDDKGRNAKEDDFVKNYPSLMKEVSKASNNSVSIDILRYLDGSMLQQLNERWRKQHFMELQNCLKRMDLTKEHLKLVLDAHTSSSKDDVDDEEAMDVDDADDELVGDNDDENKQSEDVDDEEEAVVEVESDDENEQFEDADGEEEAEVESDDE